MQRKPIGEAESGLRISSILRRRVGFSLAIAASVAHQGAGWADEAVGEWVEKFW